MTTWLTSDLHIGHVAMAPHPAEKCRSDQCQHNGWRPFDSLDHMYATIVTNWNERVQPDDLVIIIGDVVMGSREDTLPKLDALAGRKWLIPGNHDHCHPMHAKKADQWKEIYGRHVDVLSVEHEADEWVDGLTVMLCHFPFAADHTDDVRYQEWRPEDKGQWLIHGHLHSRQPTSPDRPRQIEVGMDAWGYAPVRLDTILDMIKENA